MLHPHKEAMKRISRTGSASCSTSNILRTNIRDLDGETLWKMYTQLTDVEASFRHLKMDLGIRPVYHHKEDRVQAHIIVAFLGYTLFKTLEM